MKKKFIIQNAITKKYWYGYYSNKRWTDDITEAVLFDSDEQLHTWVESEHDELNGMFLVIILVIV